MRLLQELIATEGTRQVVEDGKQILSSCDRCKLRASSSSGILGRSKDPRLLFPRELGGQGSLHDKCPCRAPLPILPGSSALGSGWASVRDNARNDVEESEREREKDLRSSRVECLLQEALEEAVPILGCEPALHRSPPKQQQQPPLTAFQRLSLVLDGQAHYLDQPGPQNRVLLSLKSTIAEDTDWALEVLLAASFYEPELLALARFPGLIDALLDLAEPYRSPGLFADPAGRAGRRRALEAALVLRNLLAIDATLAALVPNHPRLLPLVLRGLRTAQADSDHEFVGLLLDILDSLAAHNLVRLDQALRPTTPHPSQNLHNQLPESTPSRESSSASAEWPAELLASLDRLTQSSDRALVLAAYRCFTALGSLAANQAALTAELFRPAPGDEADEGAPRPWPAALERALVLLALPDVEMLMGVLDYLYTLTSAGETGLAIVLLHPHIAAILKLLLVHVHHNSRLERLPAELVPVPSKQWYFLRPPCPEPIPEDVVLSVYGTNPTTSTLNKSPGTRTAPQTLTMSEVHQILLPETQLKDIVNLSEPNRARQWMSRVFEAYPGGEVQQVTLWLAYKTQFELFQNPSHFGPGIQMIAPAEAIKLTSDVFPNALPSVTEHKSGEKKFVISGMRVRPKKRTPSSPPHFRAFDLYFVWGGCRDEDMAVRTLSRGPASVIGGGSYVHERWEPPNAGAYLPDHALPGAGGGGATGIGFVALLVLRNLLSALVDALADRAKALDSPSATTTTTTGEAEPARAPGAGWRRIDALVDLAPPSTLSAHLVQLVQLVAGLLPASDDAPPPAGDPRERLPLGFVEKEARALLAAGPHFLAVAADILHALAALAAAADALLPLSSLPPPPAPADSDALMLDAA
ncbi:hypothetical protein PtA15_3A332 [Puccinia triticina]|uniref:RFX-type winged-helix domain-containing protein n=2 Tax=Puccinia triticina TaxID=208348 RepID=A0ABY7CCM3_9BASI|nr:uncharacterized protein PtA15_3A332 [Puccinia triticina]WAQ82966.1 hypothetical protein PtA15_3A332 [Puccinia triticina]